MTKYDVNLIFFYNSFFHSIHNTHFEILHQSLLKSCIFKQLWSDKIRKYFSECIGYVFSSRSLVYHHLEYFFFFLWQLTFHDMDSGFPSIVSGRLALSIVILSVMELAENYFKLFPTFLMEYIHICAVIFHVNYLQGGLQLWCTFISYFFAWEFEMKKT